MSLTTSGCPLTADQARSGREGIDQAHGDRSTLDESNASPVDEEPAIPCDHTPDGCSEKNRDGLIEPYGVADPQDPYEPVIGRLPYQATRDPPLAVSTRESATPEIRNTC